MGMQYLGKPNQFTGDFGAYAIKSSVSQWNRWKSWCGNTIRRRKNSAGCLEMIHRKLDNLGELGEMFSSYSKLYLYEKEKNKESEFQSDYLLVHETGKKNPAFGACQIREGQRHLPLQFFYDDVPE